MTDDDDRYLSTARVAHMFDVTTYTVRDWITSGKIAGVQINGRWKILLSEVTRFANERHGSNT
jgi:predicted site-specific integrase-resolvase